MKLAQEMVSTMVTGSPSTGARMLAKQMEHLR